MIITFYSYKGGVGRSMALANVGEWLFRQGLRVIIVDWDLEAPGIENYFETDPQALRTLCESRGVVDILVNYQSAHPTLLPSRAGAESSGETPLSADEKLKVITDLLPSVAFSLLPVENSPRPSIDGKDAGIWLLSAGARGKNFPEYADHVHSFDWSAFYQKCDGAIFFRWLRAELEKFADIVLVDSRTGVTEMSGVCTRDLADLVVSFCAPNDSNLDGVVRMHRWFLDPALLPWRGGRPLRAMIVPCRVDGKSETEQLAIFKRKFFERVNALRDLDPQVNADAWWNLQIAYVSYYSFHEHIVIGRSGSEYLQNDLEKVATELTRCYLAHAAELKIDLTGRRLGRAVQELLDAGVDASVRAEAAFQRIPAEKQPRALSTLARFVKLARADEGGAITAIRVPLTVFETITPSLIDDLVQAGLVRKVEDDAGPPGAELRDEAYAYKWQRLEQFVRSDSEFILWRQEIGIYLNSFRLHGRSQEFLIVGRRLAEAEGWLQSRPEDLTIEERDFILQSTRRAKAAPSASRARFAGVAVTASIFVVLGLAWAGYRLVSERAMQRDENAIALLQREADSALLLEDYLLAISKLDQALQVAPEDAALLLKRGSAKLTASRLPERSALLAEAIDDFDRSIKIDPNRPEAYRARAEALQRRNTQGDAALADADLTQAIGLDPTSPVYVMQRARLRESRGLIEPALEDYSKVIDISPSSTEAYVARGLLLVSINEPRRASADFAQVVNIGGDQALVEVANAQLQRLGQARTSASRPRVLMQFSSKADLPLVNLVAKELEKDFDVSAPELTKVRTDGDVRYFFREDRSTATRLNTLLQAALATHGVRRQLEVIYVAPKSSSLSSAARGRLEVWLPPLTASARPASTDLTTMNVDIFWCASSGPPAQKQAQVLRDRKDAKWQGYWRVRDLSEADNARPAYQISGYQVRVSSAAEEVAGRELSEWASRTLDTKVSVVPAERLQTRNSLSVFVCPDQAAKY